ncbi:HD domain-containing protein [Noviherbaspirillum galbum]|uniref:HD domain-containing protein n=1 Tax=Noviherbaspirillum galbum TaxID=2709383 RepID=A0A6B3SXV1_9BURK|nr:hypothetical protein [Noviherbaspirillum galbum]NEX63382.1 hypothetical protein [Noviherbaspirillum galbum]
MRRQPIVKAAFCVTVFWWSLATLWQVSFDVPALLRGERVLDTHWTLSVLAAIAGGVFCGVFASVFSIWFDRRETSKRLQGSIQHGLQSSIGLAPLHYHDLRREGEPAQRIPTEAVATVPEIQSDATTDFLERWHTRFGEDYPKHAALMVGIETILMQYRHLPASHVQSGHGGRTLLSHSLLVSWYMDKLAPHHTYDGKIKLPEYTVNLTLRNESYRFDHLDPLVALIGLVHDIGKIECYQFDDKGKIIGCRPDHDSTGVRILARMPEYWALPSEDREILSVVVKFYHHPQDTPTEDGFLPLSDRLHALLELLIRADTLASRREAGENARMAQMALEAGADPMGLDAEPDKREHVWNAILDVLLRNESINGKDKHSNVGIRRFHPVLKIDMLVLKEDDFIGALCAELGRENYTPQISNAVSAMTKVVLRMLDEKGALYTQQEAGGRNPETALYRVEFYPPEKFWAEKNKTPAKDEDRGDPKFTWASCIVINLSELINHFDDLTSLARLDDFGFIPVIRNSRLGNAGKKNANKSAHDIAMENELLGTDNRVGLDLADAVAKQAAAKKNTEKANVPPASAPTAAPTPVPAPAPSAPTMHSVAGGNVISMRRLAVAPEAHSPALTPVATTAPTPAPVPSPSPTPVPTEAPVPVLTPGITPTQAPPSQMSLLGTADTDSQEGKEEESLEWRIEDYRWQLSAHLPRKCADGNVKTLGIENGTYVLEVEALCSWLAMKYDEERIQEVLSLIRSGEIKECKLKAGFAFVSIGSA